jgi:hypothetical protein
VLSDPSPVRELAAVERFGQWRPERVRVPSGGSSSCSRAMTGPGRSRTSVRADCSVCPARWRCSRRDEGPGMKPLSLSPLLSLGLGFHVEFVSILFPISRLGLGF